MTQMLKCAACGKLITKIEWEAFKFRLVYQCCEATQLQPYQIPNDTPTPTA